MLHILNALLIPYYQTIHNAFVAMVIERLTTECALVRCPTESKLNNTLNELNETIERSIY